MPRMPLDVQQLPTTPPPLDFWHFIHSFTYLLGLYASLIGFNTPSDKPTV